MAWGKTEEEKAAERAAKEQAQQQARDEELRQEQAAAKAEADAAFAASPVGRATAAHAAGNGFFQIEIEVSALTGPSSFFGSSSNEIQHTGIATDLLGQIEAVGWHLEHAGFVFIETGSTSTSRILQTGEGMVTEGNVTGIYLFRRVAA